MKRPWSALAFLLTFVGLALACHRQSPSTTSPNPSSAKPDACTVALAPGTEATDRDRAIARVQQAARGATHVKQALERLGYLYVSRARALNDAGDYRLALATADCLESRHPGEAATLLLRGHVLHQLHRFREAEGIARALLAKRSTALDYGLLGDALMEQGRLVEASSAYQKMIDIKPFYQSYTRAAHLRWLKGDLDGAISALQLAIQSASPRDLESSAWAWTRLSAYELQAGQLDEAAKAASTGLTYQSNYAAAHLAHGRALLAMQRIPDAVQALTSAARLNPLPEYQWALADALRLQGLEADAQRVEHELLMSGASADPRTLALYLATRHRDAARAITLAEEELKTRADVFTLDAHAWALAASGRHVEAREVISRATAEGTHDARLFLHAGVINLATGHISDARRWLKRAERLKATLLPSEVTELAKYLTQTL